MAAISNSQKKLLNRMSPAAYKAGLGTVIQNMEGGGTGGDGEPADLTALTARVAALEDAANPVAITSFTISDPSGAVEVGKKLTSVSFAWDIFQFAKATSAKIVDVTGSADLYTVTLASGTKAQLVNITKNTAGNNGFRLQVVAGGSTINSSTRNVSWQYATYFGIGSDTIDAAGVKALATKALKSGTAGIYEFGASEGHKWICVEKNLPQPTTFKDANTGFAFPFNEPVEVTITNDEGVEVDMYCYRSVNSMSAAVSIQLV